VYIEREREREREIERTERESEREKNRKGSEDHECAAPFTDPRPAL